MASVSRDDLIDYHYKLQLEVRDLEDEIKKVEHSNDILRRQNEHYRKLVESQLPKTNSFPKRPVHNSRGPSFDLTNVLDKEFIYGKLNKASDIYDFATGELLKHAKSVVDGVASSLIAQRKDGSVIKTLNTTDAPFNIKWSNIHDNDDDKATTTLSSNESHDEDALKHLTSDEEET